MLYFPQYTFDVPMGTPNPWMSVYEYTKGNLPTNYYVLLTARALFGWKVFHGPSATFFKDSTSLVEGYKYGLYVWRNRKPLTAPRIDGLLFQADEGEVEIRFDGVGGDPDAPTSTFTVHWGKNRPSWL